MTFLRTMNDAQIFIQKLNVLDSLIYKSNGNTEDYIDKTFSETEKNWLMSIEGPDIHSKIEKMVAEIRSLSTLQIEVPVPLTLNQVNKIHQWWNSNCSTKILFDFVVNPELMTGVVLKKDGKIKVYEKI